MKTGNARSTWLIVSSLFILMAPALMGQTSSTGALSGTVTDPTGAVVPNATVTATSSTGQARVATTGANGSYKIPLLPPGAYRVKFEAAGFQELENPSVTITVTETGTLNEALMVGAQAQQVTVEADVEAVQTANSTIGTVIKSVADFPLANRNFTVLIGLSAGANATVVNAAAGLGKGSQVTSVNGASLTDNNYQMDGVTVVNQGSNGNISEGKEWAGIPIPNPDAIEEFKIQTSNYDAGYGRNSGGNVNVVTKSGTNAYHGTAWEYFRNTVLNANDFFYKMTELSAGKPNVRQVLNQNQYGGVIGGPIKKDKFFFFASYQETNQKNGLTNQGYSVYRLPYITPPSIAADRTSAAFTNDMLAHYCGSAGTLAGIQIKAPPGGCTNTSPFFSSYNPALATANINQISLNILQVKLPNGNYYVPSPLVGNSQATCNPTPTTGSTGPTYGCTSSIPTTYAEHQGIGNLDYIINSKQTLSLRFFASEEPIDGAFFGAASYLPVQALPGEPLADYYKNYATVLKLTSILTNNLVNEARISYQHNYASQQDGNRTLTSSQVGIAPQQPGYDLFPQITYDTFSIGADTVGDALNRDNQYQFADQVSWTHGKHSIRFGGEYEFDRRKWEFPGLALGSLTYASFPDFLISLPACTPGDATCTPTHPTTTVDLSGATVQNNGTANPNVSLASGASAVRFPIPINGLASGAYQWNYFNAISAFVQDDIKINAQLTVNLGLRWEYFSAPTVDHGKNTDVWPSLVLSDPFPVVAGTQGCTGTLYQTTGCPGSSFAGYVVPSDYDKNVLPPIPAGVFQSNHKTANRTGQPWDNFGPRIGFAWQPLASNPRWVMRGGGGFFYSRVPTDTTYSNQSLEQIPQAFQVASVYNIDLPNPYGTTPAGWNPRWVTLNGASSNIRIQTMAENYPTPLTYQWNLNTQYEFAPSWVIEIGYVGSRGIHQWGPNRPNGAPLVSASEPSSTNAATTTNTTTNTALRVPYAGFATNWVVNSTPLDFKYNSAQATLRKQASHGLTFQAAYTYSRAFLSAQVGNPNAVAPGEPVTLFKYGLNPNYAPNRLTVSDHWDLPFGHPEGIKGKVVTGWSLSGVTVIQSGTPLTITDGRLGTIFGTPVASNAQFAPGKGNTNVPSSGSLYDRATSNYYNASAFATVPTGGPFVNGVAVFGNGKGYGNAGLGILLGPPQKNFDITIEKDTKVGGIREDAVLVFRAEFLNAFNHTQFSNPTSSNLSAGTFGKIQSSSVNPRLIQLALKYQF